MTCGLTIGRDLGVFAFVEARPFWFVAADAAAAGDRGETTGVSSDDLLKSIEEFSAVLVVATGGLSEVFGSVEIGLVGLVTGSATGGKAAGAVAADAAFFAFFCCFFDNFWDVCTVSLGFFTCSAIFLN